MLIVIIYLYSPVPFAQAVRVGAPSMLWQHMRRYAPAPLLGEDTDTGARNSLACALATALVDLLAKRGGDELAAAALRILVDPRLAAWYGATTVETARPPRVVAAAQLAVFGLLNCVCTSLGVRTPIQARPSASIYRTPEPQP